MSIREESGRSAFRRTGPRLMLTACGAFFFLIFASGLLGSSDHPASLAQRLSLAPFAGLTLWITVGVFRQGIWINHHGLRVRNIFKRYEAAWADIETIEDPPPYGAFRNAGIGFRLRDGRRVNAALYAAGPLNRSGFADETVEALRAELQRRAGRPGDESEAAADQRHRAAVRSAARFWKPYAVVMVLVALVMSVYAIAIRDWALAALSVTALVTVLTVIAKGRRRRGPPTAPE